MSDPVYLIIRSKAPTGRFHEFSRLAAKTGGQVTAVCQVQDSQALEPGTVAQNIWIGKFSSMKAARDAWAILDSSLLSEPEPPVVLAANAIPDDGLPPEMDFVPTRKNVDPGPAQPPTLMLIEGSASDQDEMDRYRDIILPMMRERGSYYICFQIGGDVEVLSGEWDEAIFAISRWPDSRLAQDFWLSARYQQDAIPIRLNIGSFQVVIVTGDRDDG